MRFRRLELIAFGPFTNHVIDVSRGGFCILYGRNEAGKSTALRAVRGLLFGIDERTQDAHLHAPGDLRIGACLEGANGERLELVRRKRRKDSLRDKNDEPISEAALGRLLGGVGPEVFQSMFAFDHERLKEGGEALLQGHGDVGQSLFDAAVGGRGVQRVLESLRSEADRLFKKRGHKLRINIALEEYRQAARDLREQIQPPEKWQRERQALDEMQERREKLHAERQHLREEEHRLKRTRNALQPATRRAQCHEELAALGPVVPLVVEHLDRRLAAAQALQESARESQRLQHDIAEHRAQRATLQVPEPLVDLDTDRVEQLAARLAVVQKALADLPNLQGQIRGVEDSVRAGLQQLPGAPGLEQAERLRLSGAEHRKIRRLIQEQPVLVERLRAAEQKCSDLERAHRRLQSELDRIGPASDPGPLERAVAVVRPHGDLATRSTEAERELEIAEEQCGQSILQLKPWSGRVSDLLSLPVPGSESLDYHETELWKIEQKAESVRSSREEAERLLGDLERDIQIEEASGDVPSEEQLVAARERRDHGWQRILGAWRQKRAPLEEAKTPDSERPLAQAYEKAVERADEISDRLRREAQRVTELARLRAERERAQKHLQELGRGQGETEARRRELAESWRALWSHTGIEPLSPRDMRAWVRRYAEACRRGERCRDLLRVCGEHKQLSERLAQTLHQALRDTGVEEPRDEPLSALFARAQQTLTRMTEITQRRSALSESIREQEAALVGAVEQRTQRRAELETWQAQWGKEASLLGLDSGSAPEEAAAVLEQLDQLFRSLDELHNTRRRVQHIQADAEEFNREARSLVEKFAPELGRLPEAEASERFVKLYRQGKQARLERERVDVKLVQLERALEESTQRREAAQAELDHLIRQAGVENLSELEGAEQRARRAQQLEGLIEQSEAVLVDLATHDGLTLAELLSQTHGANKEMLVSRLAEVEDDLSRLEEECRNADLDIDAYERGLERYDEQTAAEAAQEVQARAAEAGGLVERYIELRLAAVLLDREIERYRESHQEPVVKLASGLFERLTVGEYSGLRVGTDELLCVRKNAQEVEVEGLSEGVRYQLYLALRLATLEHYLAVSEPMPLVMDDVLIHFDDDRARAALQLFAELGRRSQVLLFTHHARLLELARDAIEPRLLSEHQLDARTPGSFLSAPSA